MRPSCAGILALLVTSSSCSSATTAADGDSSASNETAACTVDTPYVNVVNNTPWPMAGLIYAPCGTQDSANFPFPEQVEPGASLLVPLPEAGCYLLGVIEPSGCFLDGSPETGDLEACDTYELVLDENQFGCPGA